jgi:hypothetical protein
VLPEIVHHLTVIGGAMAATGLLAGFINTCEPYYRPGLRRPRRFRWNVEPPLPRLSPR